MLKKVPKMSTIAGSVFLILTLVTSALCQPTMVTLSDTVKVSLGGTVSFRCQVKDLPASKDIIWEFVEHNQTISVGNDIKAENHEQKYSLVAPEDSAGILNLEINHVDMKDRGSYKCYVSGMKDTVKVVHHLTITEAEDAPPAPELNVTDCCVAAGVEACALPFCSTSTPLMTLLTLAQNDACMEKNIISVLKCGQGGRNHMGCCIRRGLSDLCQNLCRGYGELDGTTYMECVEPVTMFSLVQCYKEGNAMLPSQPTGVSAINKGNEIVVTWLAPVENPDLVVGYKVQYKKKGDDVYNTTKSLASNAFMETVENLELNVHYEVQVIALASSGASQPSLPVVIATSEVIPTSNITKTIKECCVDQGISKGCQGFCDASLYYTGGHPDMLTCYAEINDIYSCVVGHGDHTPCCKRVNIPDVCLGMCRGEPNLSWEMVQCMSYMPLIQSCILEGSILLPNPPKNSRILAESVTSSSAIVTWEAPDNKKPGEFYLVSWKINKVTVFNWTSVEVLSGTQYELTGLEPESVYDVIVATVSDTGSSLPDVTLLLITKGISTEPVTAYNETECCMEKGVTGNCLQLCVHQFRMSDQALALALQCESAIAPMLICGTDGRDHTECCKRIPELPSVCLGLCQLHPTSDPTTAFLPCALQKNELSACFDEGKAVLPRPPMEVTVKQIDTHSIVLAWDTPQGPNITSYTVEYSLTGKYWEKVPDTNHTFITVKKLDPDTIYNFRVTSSNENGRSMPSVIIVANTLPLPMNKTLDEWQQLWASREDCCKQINISSECQAFCLSGITDGFDTRKCAIDIDKILACSADGRDHSNCCKNKIPGFSPTCLPFCQGQPGSRDVQSALCLTYLGPILTCFTEGQGLLPTPPTYVRAASLSSTEIEMKWTPPASNCASSCRYLVYIWEDSNRTLVTKDGTSEQTYKFSNLKPLTTYRVTVAAGNANGMSLPAPYFVVTTPSDSPHRVSVSQAPSGIIDQETAVQLECVGLGAELDSVKWVRNKQEVSTSNLYLINSASAENVGAYTCMVTFADNKMKTAALFLNVRYKPVVKKMSETTVLPGVGQDAKLSCEFEGFPDIITWTKDGNTLQGGAKYNMLALETDLKGGVTKSELVVKNVVSDDFGSYTCTGSNKFGKMHSTGNLKNMFPVTPAPTSGPQNRTDVSGCCRSKGVPDDCATRICTYTIDITQIMLDSSLTKCAAYLTEYFSCAADGKDHSQCCTKQGVTDACLPFCRGVIPDHNDQLQMLMCVPLADKLMGCLVNGMEYIPSQPNKVHAKVVTDSVRVFWDPPEKNPDKVDIYHVYYQSKSLPLTFDAASSQSRSKKLQSELMKKGETYTVWVVAINDFGTSLASEKKTVTVTKLVPPSPSNLKGEPLPDLSIDLNWVPPKTNLKIEKYAVIYQAKGGQPVTVMTNKPSTRLINLIPKRMYTISVAAFSADGEGPKSNTIAVITEDGPAIQPGTSEAHSGHETVGIAVGVVLGIIFLVTVAIVAVLLFRRLGRPKLAGNQAVAFENPQYGERVTGLPGDDDGNQFQYGKLHEDRDTEHAYMTMQDSHEDNGDTPATLDLAQA